MWVFFPYSGPAMGFGLAAGSQNAPVGSPQIFFWPGGTQPLPCLLFQGSADFPIKGLHPLWPIWWGPVTYFVGIPHYRSLRPPPGWSRIPPSGWPEFSPQCPP